jgi:hypothetical protein
MKLHHFILIFIVIAITYIVIADIKTNDLKAIKQNKEQIDHNLDTAIDDGVASLVEVDNNNNIIINKEEAMKSFFLSINSSFGVLSNKEAQEKLNLYIPVVAITVEDGYYLFYSDQYKGADGFTYSSKRWTEKFPYFYEDNDFIYGFTLGDIVTLYDKNKLLDSSGNQTVFRLDFHELMVDAKYEGFRTSRPGSFLLEEEKFHQARKGTILACMEDSMAYYTSHHNRIASQFGITYNFSFPSVRAEDWENYLDDIGMFVLFQGYPYGDQTGETYNRVASAGAKISKTKVYYLEQKGWYLVYHLDGCPELTKDDTEEEYNKSKVYEYTGTKQTFVVPKDGYYKLEAWGASGGGNEDQSFSAHAGLGGYAAGELYLKKGQRITLTVGGKGSYANAFNTGGGYNGGGNGGHGGNGGGGASDIQLEDLVGSKTFTIGGGLLDNGTNTYGPYLSIEKGVYRIEVYGDNLSNCTVDSITSDDMAIYEIQELSQSKNYMVFQVVIPKDIVSNGSHSGIEFRIFHGNVTGYRLDKMVVTQVDQLFLVAGGGGGADDTDNAPSGSSNDGSGGAGGLIGSNAFIGGSIVSGTATGPMTSSNTLGGGTGYGGTQTGGFRMGIGESVTYPTDTGGAGGGYWGGLVTNHNNGGGGGGSSYIGGVINSVTRSGERYGNGKIVFHWSDSNNGPSQPISEGIVFFNEPYYTERDCIHKGAYSCDICIKNGVRPPNDTP